MLTIDHKPLSWYNLRLSDAVEPHASIIQLTGSRSACKQLCYHLALELRNKCRYGEDTYHLIDTIDQADVGQFHDYDDAPQLVFNAAWLAKQA